MLKKSFRNIFEFFSRLTKEIIISNCLFSTLYVIRLLLVYYVMRLSLIITFNIVEKEMWKFFLIKLIY